MPSPDRPEQDVTDLAKPHQTAIAEFNFFNMESLFALSPDAILATDSVGIIRGSNPQATELFGYAQAELIGMRIESLLAERFRSCYSGHRENLNADPRARPMGSAMDLFCLRKDGTERPVDVLLRPMPTNAVLIELIFFRDTSEQRAALEAVRRREQQICSIVESVLDYALFLLDLDGHVATWHKGAECIHGYRAEEIVGEHFSIFFTQEDIERGHPAELLRLAGKRGGIGDEGWRVRKDGSRFWANSTLTAVHDSAGAMTGYSEVTRDATDHHQAAESVMLQMSLALLADMDARKLLGVLSESIRDLIPHDAATLALFDAPTGMLKVQFLGLDGVELHRDEVRLPVAGSPAGEAFRTREPLLLERMEGSPFPRETMLHLTRLGMQSGCWVPVIHRGQPIGTLAVASRLEAAFACHNAGLLAQVANQVAMVVNSRVFSGPSADQNQRTKFERQVLEDEMNTDHRFEDIVGESSGLRNVLNDVATVAPTDATVLIQGETGTGKELLARAIHRLSLRNEHPFIKLNCAAIPPGLLESELFGHEKGAFTGAIARKLGRLELAQEGTLFLDEIGELPLDLQPKVLRALQEREIERLGGTRPIKVNVRLIAATNRDLARMVAEKQFRADLFYRLKVFPIFAPSLRDRVSDIPALVRHFVTIHSRHMGKVITTIPEATMASLKRWTWPGNIRELENFLERAVILTRGSVLYVPLAELEAVELERAERAMEDNDRDAPTRGATHAAAERQHIVSAMREAKGHISGENGAAARLGLPRTTLNSKLKKLAIAKIDYM
jgi:formate hydrogenlyase transcriptional activator